MPADSKLTNKPSSVDTKEMMLRMHIVPRLGHLKLDAVTHAVIEDVKLALGNTPVANAEKPKNAENENAPRMLCAKLGHATIMMTMRYAHLAPEIVRDAVRLLDGGKTVAKNGVIVS